MQSPSTLPDGSLTNAYNYTLQATGGVSTYTWSITSGHLQPGLSLNTSTGAITGTPTAGPQNTITFHVTDGTNTANLTATLKVSSVANTATFVQGKTGAVPDSATFASNVTSGHLIFVDNVKSLNDTFDSCTDSIGTTFQFVLVNLADFQAGPTYPNTVSVGIAPSSGADTVTCGTGKLTISEFSNMAYFGNDNANLLRAASASPITSTSLTTLVPGEMLYSTLLDNSLTLVAYTIDSPFTLIGTATDPVPGYLAATTVTGYTSTYTLTTGSSTGWAISLMGIRPTGGAAAPGPMVPRHPVFIN